MALEDARPARLARSHGARLSVFSFIGAAVFVAGVVFQVTLVRYAGFGADSSYAAQAIFSIELSYLLNRYLTWRNSGAGFWLACWKFNVQKLVMTVVNMAAYAVLVRIGLQYIAANVVLTAVFTPVNYFTADLLVFVRPRRRQRYQRRHARIAGRAMAEDAPEATVVGAVAENAAVEDTTVGVVDGALAKVADEAVAGEVGLVLAAVGEGTLDGNAGQAVAGEASRMLAGVPGEASDWNLGGSGGAVDVDAVDVDAGRAQATEAPFLLPAVLPSVSVIIPCKDSGRTIRQTVEAMLAQDYPALNEVILVGDIGDSTWAAVADITDSRLVVLEQEKTPGRRDPNVKRDKGIRKSNGDILALADSDVIPETGWLTCAVGLLHRQGGGLVAGGLRTVHDTFWGRFVDRNGLAPKTPRVRHPYRVTAKRFGARGQKPPVTANVVFTRELYNACQLDVTWAYGYEDYEWFWRLARDRHEILISPQLTMAHHHRRSFGQLIKEYQRSAHGCAQFIREHPDSPLSRKRWRQAFGFPLAALLGLGAAILGVSAGDAAYVAAALAAVAVAGVGYEAAEGRSFEAITYTPASLALGGIYALTMAVNLLRPANLRPAPAREAPTWAAQATTEPPPRSWARRVNWPLTAILALQTTLSLNLVWSNTAFGDEATYLSAGRLEWDHWLHGTPLPGAGQANFGFAGTFQSYFSGAPQIYPPLGAAATFVGGLAAARILGLCFMLGACVFLYLTARRIFGPRAALFSAGAWAVSAPVLRLAFATYDPMAIFLVCGGTWVAVESGYRRHRPELIAGSALLLVFGAATAYSYAIFVPAGILLASLSWVPRFGWRSSLVAASWLTGLTTALLVMIPTVLKVWQGVFSTTLSRRGGNSGVLSVVQSSWELTGLIAVLALIGALAAFRSPASRVSEKMILGFCAAAALLVPLEQVHLQTGTSLDKHLSVGAWFAAIGAGYALSKLVEAIRWRRSAVTACAAAAIVFPATNGWISAFSVYHLWPNASAYIAAIRPLVAQSNGNLLVVQYSSLTEYYVGGTGNWQRWTALSLDPAYTGVPSADWVRYYQSQIAATSPQVVAIPMNVTFTSQAAGEVLLANLTDALRSGKQAQLRKVLLQIAAADVSSTEPGFFDLASAVADDPGYHVVAVTPYDSHIATGVFVIWQQSQRPPGGHAPGGQAPSGAAWVAGL
jgi:glycosyltransferase involved in cell wall biosynthesis/putative flippase GtrA